MHKCFKQIHAYMLKMNLMLVVKTKSTENLKTVPMENLKHLCMDILYFNKHTNQTIISCFSFDVNLPDGKFVAFYYKSNGWTHLVLNYIGPNDGAGIKMYINGAEVARDTTKDTHPRPAGTEEESDTTKYGGSYSAGDGRIVVGRYYTNQDRYYASVQVDELLFFNQTLTAAEIEALSMDWPYILIKV